MFKTIRTKREVEEARQELLAIIEEETDIINSLLFQTISFTHNIIDAIQEEYPDLITVKNKFNMYTLGSEISRKKCYDLLEKRTAQLHMRLANLKVNI